MIIDASVWVWRCAGPKERLRSTDHDAVSVGVLSLIEPLGSEVFDENQSYVC